MTLDAGRLRHRIVIQRNDPAQDLTTGAMIDAWTNYATLWAAIEPLSVREFIAASATQSEVSARITIRARNDLTPDMRILHGGKIYSIVGFLRDADSGLEYMTIPVSEGVNVRGT